MGKNRKRKAPKIQEKTENDPGNTNKSQHLYNQITIFNLEPVPGQVLNPLMSSIIGRIEELLNIDNSDTEYPGETYFPPKNKQN